MGLQLKRMRSSLPLKMLIAALDQSLLLQYGMYQENYESMLKLVDFVNNFGVTDLFCDRIL